MSESRSGDFVDIDPQERLSGPHPSLLQRKAAKAVRENQDACYETRNETCRRRWWPRAMREAEKWACVRQEKNGHKVRYLFFSSDGRIATGRFYPNPGAESIAYIREDESLWYEQGMLTVVTRLANELPKRVKPSVCTG